MRLHEFSFALKNDISDENARSSECRTRKSNELRGSYDDKEDPCDEPMKSPKGHVRMSDELANASDTIHNKYAMDVQTRKLTRTKSNL